MMVLFWAAADMTHILHDCTVADISRAPSPNEGRLEHLDYGLFMEQARKCADFDEATCWFRTVDKYADYVARMSVPVKDEKSLRIAAKILQKAPPMLNGISF
jgi:hypothetical protein